MRTSRRLWSLTLFLLGVIVGWILAVMWSNGEQVSEIWRPASGQRVVVNHDLRPAVAGGAWDGNWPIPPNWPIPATRALTVQPVTPSPPVMPPRPGAGRPHLGQLRFQAPPVDLPQ